MERLHTLVFTDLVDSTALNRRLGDALMAAVWDAHDTGSRRLLQQWGGLEVDRTDGFFAVFDDANLASRFIQEYHQLLATLSAPLMARAAMHVGALSSRHSTPAEIANGAKPVELIGIAKAHCARLMALARPGQTLSSAEAATLLASADLRCQSHGFWRLKGLEEPVEVFEVIDHDKLAMPPQDGEKAYRVVRSNGHWMGLRDVPQSMPAEPDAFFGRVRELSEICEAFDSGHSLLTLTGAGGIGKTRLALRYAHGWLGEHSGGVYFCDLSQARDIPGIAAAVARALRVPLGNDPIEQLANTICGLERSLLILDNFEQVVACAPETVGVWQRGASRARLLVTSRERLGLPGEHAIVIQPLDIEAAVALFHDRARSVRPDYADLSPSDEVMHRLARMLDGLPLAIELAAARVSITEPDGLLELMGQRFRLLVSRSGRPSRQATLAATLQWSWDLLSAAERCALAQLSVFEGPFPLGAAQAVLDVSHIDVHAWSLDVLQALVDKSLLRSVAAGSFQFLGAIREMAFAQLQAPGRFPASGPSMVREVRSRHYRYYSTLGEAAATANGCAEVENLVAACRNASADGAVKAAVANLLTSWSALRLVGPFATAVELVRRIDEIPEIPPKDRAAVRWVHGAALYAAGDAREARAEIARGLSMLPTDASPLLAARLHCSFGEVLSVHADGAAAKEHLQLAATLADRDGTASIRCQVLNALGALAQEEGKWDDARTCYRRALEIAESANDRRWQAAVLGNLAVLDLSARRLEDALSASQRGLMHAEAANDLRWVGNANCNLGLIHYEQGDLSNAEKHLERALKVARQLGHRALEFMTLCNLGLVAEARGDLAAACNLHRDAVVGAEQLGDLRVEAQLRTCLGSALARFGLHEEARRCLQRAHAHVSGASDQTLLGLVLCSIVENEALDGQHKAASEIANDIARAVRETGSEPDSELGRRYAKVRILIRD